MASGSLVFRMVDAETTIAPSTFDGSLELLSLQEATVQTLQNSSFLVLVIFVTDSGGSSR